MKYQRDGWLTFAQNIHPMRTIFLAFLLQLVTLTVASAQQDYYTVKFPDDMTVIGCGGQADVIWPEITKTGYCGFNVGVSMTDAVFTLNATGTCKKIVRTWKLLWWCDYNPNWMYPTYIENPGYTDVGATAIGNSVNHGYLQYIQIIKIVDNVAPVFLNCPTTTPVFCDPTTNDPLQYNNGVDLCEGPVNLKVKVTDACSKSHINLAYRLFLDLDGNGTMETFRSSSTIGAWAIERTVVADTVFAKVKLPPGVGLPYGTHKIEWIANDNCGSQTVCKYNFIVKDCKPPTVTCFNGLSINIMPGGMITLWASDFLKQTYDNCTPANQIKIGIRKVGGGTGFPANSLSIDFDCSNIGTNLLELWAVDAYGNADYCSTYINVQDNIGTCPSPAPITGDGAGDRSPVNAASNQERAIFQPVAPNPTQGPIHLSYWLPKAGPVTLTLTDLNGRLLQTSTSDQEAGYQQAELLAPQSGLLFLHLQWPGGSEVQRVVVQ